MKTLKLLSLFLFLITSSSAFSQQSPIPCSNPANPPGETACLATPICDFNGYCGRTLSSYAANAWPDLTLAIKNQTLSLGGLDWLTIENDSYLKFIASASSISFNVYVYDCYGFGTKAIQVVFFSAASCSNGPVSVVYANAQMNQQAAPHAVNVTGLVPGQVYYILIDGYSSKNCGYTFEAVSGVDLPQVAIDIAPNATICSGDNVVANVTGGDGINYIWNGATGLSSTSGSTVTITPPTAPGTYVYAAAASSGTAWCPNNSSDTLKINVINPVTFSNVTQGPCSSNAYSVSGTIESSQNPSTGNLVVEDCDGNQTIIASAPFTGTSFPFNLTNLDADGANCSLTAYFTAANCPNTYDFVAPSPCTGCTNVTITFTNTVTNTSCGNSDGKIILTGGGGTAPYSYSIDNGVTFQNTDTFTNLSAGTYNIIVKDNNGCNTNGTLNVTNLNGPTISSSNFNSPSCFNVCDGDIQLTVSGGATPYSYQWTMGQLPIGGNVNQLNDLCHGTYSVLVTDNNNCTTTATFTLVEQVAVDASFSGLSANLCNTNPIVTLIPLQKGGVFSGPGVIGNTFNPAIAGNGTHVISYQLGGNSNCSATSTFTVSVSGPTADFTANPMITDVSNTEITFGNLSEDATSYSWNFGDNSNLSSEIDPTHIFPNDKTGEYTVQLTAKDNAGCTSIKTIKIIITALEMTYEIPNIFTPNGDYSNEYFELISSVNVVGLEVIVLNRWGNLVFESKEVNFKWNGQVQNQGSECAEGTYFYKMKIQDLNGLEKEEQGFVQLSRGSGGN